MSCSRNKNVRLWGTFCLTWTRAFQVFFAANFVQSEHWPCCTRYSISKICSRIVAVRTSFWIVSETRNRFEWGSVQMKCASVSRTLFRPFNFLRQIARSSWDSGRAIVHDDGGERNRSQFLQYDTEAALHQYQGSETEAENSPCLGIPSVISTVFLKHATHRLAEFGTIGVPQSAHRIWWTAGDGMNSILPRSENR